MLQIYYVSWGEYYNYSGDKKQSLTIHVAKVGASFKHVATKDNGGALIIIAETCILDTIPQNVNKRITIIICCKYHWIMVKFIKKTN